MAPTPTTRIPAGALALAGVAACAFLTAVLGGSGRLVAFTTAAAALTAGLLHARRWAADHAAQRADAAATDRLASALAQLGPEFAAELVRQGASDIAAGVARGAAGAGFLSDQSGASLAARAADALTVATATATELSALLDALPEPVLLVGATGHIERHNSAAGELLGPMLAPGAGIDDLFAQADLADALAAARADQPSASTLRLVTGGQVRTFELAARRLRRPRELVAITLRDVTEMATTSQFKTDFVANASHELRTPIASIRTAAETLRGAGRDDPAMRDRVLGMIEQNALRLEEMVRDLLDLSRLESPVGLPERREFAVAQLESALRPMFEPLCAQRGLSLVFHVEHGAERARTDPKILQLIVRNLVDNSVKFAYSGTTITVRARAAGDELVLSVADQGEGIPLAHQQRIFERFYQVDTARTGGVRRGTGLGLAIVKHATRALGGTVAVRSVYKEGSEFTVRLPDALAMPNAG